LAEFKVILSKINRAQTDLEYKSAYEWRK
jgi:hypothetical protein